MIASKMKYVFPEYCQNAYIFDEQQATWVK